MAKKFLFYTTLFIFCCSWQKSLPVSASGILHAKIWETVNISEKSNNSGNLKWILKQEEEVLNTQTGRNFSYTFEEAGEFEIILNLVNDDEVIDSTIKVFVGTNYLISAIERINETTTNLSNNFQAILETLPEIDEENRIFLKGESGEITFMSASSLGEIAEYQIDKNIYFDSDDNGDPADDIDNQDDISFLTGSAWTTDFQKSWWEIASQLTIVDQAGEKTSIQVQVGFVDKLDLSWALEAKLLNLPCQNQEDQKIHLSGDSAKITFLANLSQGEITEYRIDKNIYFDSSGDGDPANDIDNYTDASFFTGENFETDYEKSWGKIAVQLTVVSKEGKGSRIQREIVFDEEIEESAIEAELWAEKTEIFVDEEVNFEIRQGAEKETYFWDFDGDSKIDLETQNQQISHQYTVAGLYLVTLQTTNEAGKSVVQNQKIVVKEEQTDGEEFETQVPLVNFEYLINGPKVTFVNKTAVDPHLQNQDYCSEWDFWDGETSTEQSPVHEFPEIANYNVTLKITDSVARTNLRTEQITIETLEETIEAETQTWASVAQATGAVVSDTSEKNSSTEKQTEDKNLLWGIISIFVYLIGGLLALILLAVWGYLIYLKIKHPDFTFFELIEEERNRFFGQGSTYHLGQDSPQSETVQQTAPKPNVKPDQNTQNSFTQTAPKQTPVSEQSTDSTQTTNVPEWLKQAQQKTAPVQPTEQKKVEPIVPKQTVNWTSPTTSEKTVDSPQKAETQAKPANSNNVAQTAEKPFTQEKQPVVAQKPKTEPDKTVSPKQVTENSTPQQKTVEPARKENSVQNWPQITQKSPEQVSAINQNKNKIQTQTESDKTQLQKTPLADVKPAQANWPKAPIKTEEVPNENKTKNNLKAEEKKSAEFVAKPESVWKEQTQVKNEIPNLAPKTEPKQAEKIQQPNAQKQEQPDLKKTHEESNENIPAKPKQATPKLELNSEKPVALSQKDILKNQTLNAPAKSTEKTEVKPISNDSVKKEPEAQPANSQQAQKAEIQSKPTNPKDIAQTAEKTSTQAKQSVVAQKPKIEPDKTVSPKQVTENSTPQQKKAEPVRTENSVENWPQVAQKSVEFVAKPESVWKEQTQVKNEISNLPPKTEQKQAEKIQKPNAQKQKQADLKKVNEESNENVPVKPKQETPKSEWNSEKTVDLTQKEATLAKNESDQTQTKTSVPTEKSVQAKDKPIVPKTETTEQYKEIPLEKKENKQSNAEDIPEWLK